MVLSRKRKGNEPCWRIRSTPPSDKSDDGSWIYSVEDATPWTLNVLTAPPKNNKATSSWVQAPKRTFGNVTLEDFLASTKETKAKAEKSLGNESAFPKKGKGKAHSNSSSRDRSRSPKKGDQTTTGNGDTQAEESAARAASEANADDNMGGCSYSAGSRGSNVPH